MALLRNSIATRCPIAFQSQRDDMCHRGNQRTILHDFLSMIPLLRHGIALIFQPRINTGEHGLGSDSMRGLNHQGSASRDGAGRGRRSCERAHEVTAYFRRLQ
jgi:hypothetical protein